MYIKTVRYLKSTIFIFIGFKYNYVTNKFKICHEDRHTKQFVELEDDCDFHSLPRVLLLECCKCFAYILNVNNS